MQEFGYTPSEQFQAPPAPRAEPGPQQAPSAVQSEVIGPIKAAAVVPEVHMPSPFDEYKNEIAERIADAERQVEHAREYGRGYARFITKEEQEALEPIYQKALAGEKPTKEEMERYNATWQPGVNKPLKEAEVRLQKLKATYSDNPSIAAEVRRNISTLETSREGYRSELRKPQGTLEGDGLFFPLEEEILEKEKLQAQAPTPERAVIINFLKEQLKKTKRGQAAVEEKYCQKRIDWLTKVQQSIPLPAPQ